MKKAIILEGWFNTAKDNWYPWLKKELETRGYEVWIPELPTIDTKLPSLTKMLQFIDHNFTIDKNTTIIGHSLGAVLALRLAEKYKYKKAFLVAGWDFDDLTPEHKLFWPNKIGHDKIRKNVKEIYIISSDNDPYTTAITAEGMSERLGGIFILVKNAVHFSEKQGGITKIPQILKYI